MTDISTRPDVGTNATTDDGDHDRFAHYVVKADLDAAQAQGVPIRALCGKIWTPDRDPSKYPICPTCKDLAARWNRRGDN